LSPQACEWRRAVFERVAYTCEKMCCQYSDNKKEAILNAHHIKEWSRFPEFRFNITNGISLCMEAHRKIKNEEQFF
jgi:predicted restriction endonuclease